MPLTKETHSGRPVQAVVIGAGNRGTIYAAYALAHPDQMQIASIVEPDALRRNRLADKHNVPESRRFATIEQLIAYGRLGDAAINGTMDSLHVSTSMQLLEAGYDVLLEKPIGISREEVMELLEASRRCGKRVMICHVLRYAPFYQEIRKRIVRGDIGDILNIQTAEHVSYHHMAAAFVRGKWNNKERSGSSMLMAKCCHDLDLLSWFKQGIRPVRVTSAGGIGFFREDKAPKGSGSRCLVDCEIEAQCDYSARKHYIDQDRWGVYVWRGIEHLGRSPSVEQKLQSLREDNPHGRCVWRCDNNVVDHQSVVVAFADGSTATHNLVGNASRPCRTVHIVGTKGEIRGIIEDGSFVVRHPDTRPGGEYTEELVELNVSMDMHGGGDMRLVEDFVRIQQGRGVSLSSTTLEDSIYGHLIGFGADDAMESGTWFTIPKLS